MPQLLPTVVLDDDILLAQIPGLARNILLIDCGDGRFGKWIKDERVATVIGLESDPEQASQARSVLDDVLQVEPDVLLPGFADDSFDCILWTDGFSRVPQPDRMLKRLRRWLKPDGRLVMSVPNVHRHEVLHELLKGRWVANSNPVGQRPDLKFYTRREIEKLLFRSGFLLEELAALPGTGYDDWQRLGKPGRVELGTLRISELEPSEAQEFYTSGYLVRAVPDKTPDHALTSIVLVLHNQFAYTKMCLDSLRQFTDEPYELILVDNHSTDETPRYLQSLSGVKVISNQENRGFPAAANQGIQASRGENILLLNNDTIVTTGWLRLMLDALHSAADIGLVGPCSNNVSGPQQIPVTYQDLAELDGFAWERQIEQATSGNDRVTDIDRLVGFCLLFKREVVERIGLLDERFGVGNFEDDDFCLRALQAGYRAVIAQDAFVHHFGSVSFRGAGVNFAAILRENQKKFENKWNDQVHLGSPNQSSTEVSQLDQVSNPPTRPQFLLTRSRQCGLLLKKNDLKISLCMIVRDNEGTIRPCLESIKPFVDEMIVVDTGSKDRTPQIAEELGARLFHFPWCDDFSAARNESLKHARGEWVFWMDSDDTIDEENGRKLREFVYGRHEANCLGYVMQVHCPGPSDNGAYDVTVVDHVKLFRNRPDLRFDFRIHEQILPSIRSQNGEVAFTNLFVVHSGSDHSANGRKRKLERDFRILHQELEERPDHPFVLFNLGMTCADAEKYDEAIEYLQRCLAVSQPGESHLRKAFALLVNALAQSKQYEQAGQICRDGLDLFPDDKELLFRSAMIYHHCGDLQKAEQAYLQVLNGQSEFCFSSIDAGIGGFKTRHNLAVVYDDLGELDNAEQQWRLAVEEEPRYRPGWQGLRETLFKRKDVSGLKRLIQSICTKQDLQCEALIASSRLTQLQGDLATARAELEKSAVLFPGEPEVWRELSRFIFEHSDPAEAKPELERLVSLEPEDAAAWHNLGIACLRQQEYEPAAAHFRQSLQLRPDSPETEKLLEKALRNTTGHKQGKNPDWQDAQARFPQHHLHEKRTFKEKDDA